MKAEMRERRSGAPAAGPPRSRRGQKHSSLESLEGVWPYRHLGVLVWPGLSDSPAARSRPQIWPRETSSAWSERNQSLPPCPREYSCLEPRAAA